MKSCHLKQHAGTGDHYVKWNKPGTDRQIVHEVDLKEVDSRMVITRGRVE
jgi:hypothetical protein